MRHSKGFPTVVAVCLLLTGCSSDGTNTDGDAASTPPPSGSGSGGDFEAFESEVADLCERLVEASDAVDAAATDSEFDQAVETLADEQQRFVEEASRLTPPPEIEEPFGTYVDGVRHFIELNARVESAGSILEQLSIELEAAEQGVTNLEAKEEAGLPNHCAPRSGGEVYGYLFQARANLACEELAAEFAPLERSTDTRTETAQLVEKMQDLAASHADAIEKALPPQVGNDDIEQMIQMYKRQVPLIERMRKAFVTEDEGAFEKALRERSRLVARADRIASSYGLTRCVRFMDVSGT